MEHSPESVSLGFYNDDCQYSDPPLKPLKIFIKDLWKIRFRDKTKQFFILYIVSIVLVVALLSVDMNSLNTIDEEKNPVTAPLLQLSSSLEMAGNVSLALSPNSTYIRNIQAFLNQALTPIGKKFIIEKDIEGIRDYFYNSTEAGIGIHVIKEPTISSTNDENGFDFSLVQKDYYYFDTLSAYGSFVMNAFDQVKNETTPTPSFGLKYFAHPNMKVAFGFEAVTAFYIILAYSYISIFASNFIFKLNKGRVLFYLNINGLNDIKMYFSNVLCSFIEIIPISILVTICVCFVSKSTKDTNILIVLVSTLFFAIGRTFFVYVSVSIFCSSANLFGFHYLTIYLSPIIFMILSMFREQLPEVLFLILGAISPSQGYMNAFTVFIKCKEELGPLSFSQMNTAFEGMTMSETIGLQFCSIVIMFILMALFILNTKKQFGQPIIGWKNMFKANIWQNIFRKRNKRLVKPKTDKVIKLTDIEKTYKGHVEVKALNGANAEIKSNEVIVLIGPNGSGKSTLIDSIIGTIGIDKGKIEFFDEELDENFRYLYDNLGIVFQENVLIDELTVAEHFELIGSLYSYSKEKVKDNMNIMMSMLEMEDSIEKMSCTLSGGQKRKLCIALALLSKPPLMIFDEPTAGVDVQSRQIIWKTLSIFKNTTSLITSHALEEAEMISSRLFVMVKGQISFMGTPAELREETHCGYLLNIIEGDTTREKLQEFVQKIIPEVSIIEGKEKSVIVPADLRISDLLQSLEKEKESLGLIKYDIHIQSLEESLIKLIENEEVDQMK